jgi:hypothetical protein
METIRELLSRLSTLTADELAELRAQIVAEAERLDVDTASIEDIAILQELAGFGEQVMAEQAARDAAAAQAQADREAARERIAALNPPAEETEEESTETPAAEEETDEQKAAREAAEAEAEETPAATPSPAAVPEPVAASGEGTQVERMAARQSPPEPSPETRTPSRRRATLTAAGALRGRLDPSKPIEDPEELAAAMAETLDRLPRQGSPRGDVLLASASWEYPEERQLGSDAWETSRKMDAVTSPQALTATGGICAPTNVDYAVEVWATAERPVRDAFPGFGATRGGILFVAPPDIAALAGATGIWTEATDLSPGASTKPVIQVACGSTTQVFVEAVSTRLGFGNMQSRFAPEQVAANTDLAIAAAARIADNNLLNLLAAVCTQGVTTATLLGATRDLLTALNQSVAAYRNSHRIPRSQTLTAIFPDWVRELIKADLAREIGHQQDSSWNSLMITDQQVDELLRGAGVNPVFHLDGQPSGVSGGVAQSFAVQTGSAVIEPFPTKMVWYLFAEGQIQYLDGGRLDLGVVRDSTLDATNDYETFVEVFENLAFRGFTGGAIQYVSTLCANGGSAGTISTAGSCA